MADETIVPLRGAERPQPRTDDTGGASIAQARAHGDDDLSGRAAGVITTRALAAAISLAQA